MEKETTAPLRGTIILDQSAIWQLSKEVPRQFIRIDANPRPRNYLDLFNFLARNGFEIQIPQMISHEGPGVLATGESRYDLCTYDDRFDNTIQNAWLKQVAKGKIPNISIVENTGPAIVDDYCARVHDAISSENIALYAQINDSLGNKSQFGDMAINSMLQKRVSMPPLKPTWVFTNDKVLDENVSDTSKKTKGLNNRRLLHVLGFTGLLEEAGFKPDVNGEDIWQDILHQHGETFPPLNPNFIANIERHDWRFIDACQATKAEIDKEKEIAKKEEDTVSEAGDERPPSGIEKFTERYGRFNLTTRGGHGSGKS